jgi:FixJ family two-component response regulator
MQEQRPRVAVVDDDGSVRRALERLLRAAGFDVQSFASAPEFFCSLETQRPNCIVLDLHMPGINGLEVQRRLLEAEIHVPVVVITGHDEPQTRAQCLNAGAADYLCKPLNDEALILAIQSALSSVAKPPAH